MKRWIIPAALALLAANAHACQPTQAGGTGTEYRVAELDGATVAAWLCGKTWEWVGAPAIGLGLGASKGKALADKLTALKTQRDHANDEYRALFWPMVKALIEGEDRKVIEGAKA